MRNEALQKLAMIRINLSNELAEMINSEEDLEGQFRDGYSPKSEEILELGDKIVKLGFILMHMPQDDQPKQAASPSEHPTWDQLIATAGQPIPAPEPASWDRFIGFVNTRQLNPSAAELCRLLRIDIQTSMRCVAHFASLCQKDLNGTIGKLNSLGAQLKINANGSLNLIRELFNLQGDVAIHVYERLKATTA